MQADVIFNAKLNQAVNEWDFVTGNSAIANKTEFERIVNKMSLNFAGRPDAVKTACTVDGENMLVLVSQHVKNLFPEGHPNHDWAWEVGKAGGRSRQMEYILGYSFKKDGQAIPHISVIKEQAEKDAKHLLTLAYDAIAKTGKGVLPDQPATLFPHAGPPHEGMWKGAMEQWMKGAKNKVVPFINAGEEYIACPFPKADIPVQEAAAPIKEAAAKTAQAAGSAGKDALKGFMTGKGIAITLGAAAAVSAIAYFTHRHLALKKEQDASPERSR